MQPAPSRSMAASLPAGITVIPAKAREARMAASRFAAVAICVVNPRRVAPSASWRAMFSSEPNKEARPARSRTILSAAVSSIRGETDQPRSSNAAWAIFSCIRERWRSSISPNCCAWDFAMPSLTPAFAAASFTPITCRMGAVRINQDQGAIAKAPAPNARPPAP